MKAEIEENHLDTIRFWNCVLKQFSEYQPLKKNQLVEIKFEDGIKPFPRFLEFAEPNPEVDTDSCQIANQQERMERRFMILWKYIQKKLGNSCVSSVADNQKPPSKRYIIYFTVLNPKKLESILEKPKIISYLNKVGDLWREPKNKLCYSMGENSNRHKIIRYLAKNKEYQRTDDIANYLEGKNRQYIRTEILKIKGNIKKHLHIKGDELIQSKKGSGYRINPRHEIRLIFP